MKAKRRMTAYDAGDFEVGEVFTRTPSSRKAFVVTEKGHDYIKATGTDPADLKTITLKSHNPIFYLRKVKSYENN